MLAVGTLLLVHPVLAIEAAASPAGENWAGLNDLLEILGTVLLWLAALLTLITGWDYFRKGVAYILRQEGN